jgi:hypothetical protein
MAGVIEVSRLGILALEQAVRIDLGLGGLCVSRIFDGDG